MNIKLSRSTSTITFVLAVTFFWVDGLLIHYEHSYDGFGLILSFVLPPIGGVFASLALIKTNSRVDVILLALNVIAFFQFPFFMFFGYLFFGP
jgi:hypothetical protein